MTEAGMPHVRIFEGVVYIERVPNYWVEVCSKETYDSCTKNDDTKAILWMISKAKQVGKDFEWPPKPYGQVDDGA